MCHQGKDDLRQDAVMQQVFGMVNNLLAKEQNTRKRQLRVRRYKVRISYTTSHEYRMNEINI